MLVSFSLAYPGQSGVQRCKQPRASSLALSLSLFFFLFFRDLSSPSLCMYYVLSALYIYLFFPPSPLTLRLDYGALAYHGLQWERETLDTQTDS